MGRLLKIEFYKLFHTKQFWICIGTGCLICVFSILYCSGVYRERLDYIESLTAEYGTVVNPDIPAVTLYNTWIGNEGVTFSFSVLYFIFPLLCCIPYGWTINADIRSGYIKNIAVRSDRKNYFIAKYICTLVSGGVTMLVPLIFNFMSVASFIPAYRPDPVYPYYLMNQAGFLSDMYCEAPLAFNLIYLIFTFIYCGLMATVSFACGCFFKSRVMSVIIPAVAVYTLHYFSSMTVTRYDWSPLYCIHATPVRFANTGWSLMIYGGLMLMAALVVFFVERKRQYEVY